MLHIRSLCYGICAALYTTYCVRLVDSLHRQTASHARFVFICSSITFAFLAAINIAWFFFDFMDENTGMWYELHHRLYYCMHLAEMLVVPLMGAAMICMSRLKRFRLKNMLMWMCPALVLSLAYAATGINALFFMAFGCMFIYFFIIFISSMYYVRYYQEMLNNTYANTEQRGVSWILNLLWSFSILFSVWVFLIFVVNDLTGDIIYILIGIIPWSYYVIKICRQNFDIKVMREMAEVDEALQSVLLDSPQPAAPSAVPYIDVEPRSQLKKWQEPQFDEAVRAFCNDRKNFTNSELSVQDVANGVGSNRTYVSRWCKEQGTDFSGYITDIRLDYARHLLSTTDKPIVEIVDLSGFSTPRYFRIVFSAKYGCTPSEYRVNHVEDDIQEQ